MIHIYIWKATNKSSNNQVSFKTPWINDQHNLFTSKTALTYFCKMVGTKIYDYFGRAILCYFCQSYFCQKSTESTYKCPRQNSLIVIFSSFKLWVQGSLNGSLYYQPKQCTFLRELPQHCNICLHCLIPPKKEFHEPCGFSWQENLWRTHPEQAR